MALRKIQKWMGSKAVFPGEENVYAETLKKCGLDKNECRRGPEAAHVTGIRRSGWEGE